MHLVTTTRCSRSAIRISSSSDVRLPSGSAHVWTASCPARARTCVNAAEAERQQQPHRHAATARAPRLPARFSFRYAEPTGTMRRKRQGLADAKTTAERAGRDRAAAEWRLDHSGLRQRRQARRDFGAADNRAMWANHQLDQAEAETRPHIERYNRATAAADNARTALHHHLLDTRRDRLVSTTIPDLKQQCDALDTWRRWPPAPASTPTTSALPSTP